MPGYIVLILASATFNYGAGMLIERHPGEKLYVALGVAANLILLGIFKYLDFAIGTANAVLATNWTFINIVLPLGVSFFTFTQITYLVDLYRGQAKTGSFGEYLLFVTFFPHLIARTEAVVKKIGLATGVTVAGSYDPAVTKCTEAEFWDGMHARSRCLDQILRPALAIIAAANGA